MIKAVHFESLILKVAQSRPFLDMWFRMSSTHQHGIINLFGIDLSANRFFLFFFITFIFFPSFLLVSPCFSHLLFIIIIGPPLYHRYASSSSLEFLFIIVIALIGISFLFLVADTQLYKRLCPSVCWSISP